MEISSPQDVESVLKEGWNDRPNQYTFSNHTVGCIIEAVRRDSLDPHLGVYDEWWVELSKRLKGGS